MELSFWQLENKYFIVATFPVFIFVKYIFLNEIQELNKKFIFWRKLVLKFDKLSEIIDVHSENMPFVLHLMCQNVINLKMLMNNIFET